jgi:metal-dependent hydrolase (beta-lactamase superfamily II)
MSERPDQHSGIGKLGAATRCVVCISTVMHCYVDLTKLDFVILSHRHSDHMAGLAHVLSVNCAELQPRQPA